MERGLVGVVGNADRDTRGRPPRERRGHDSFEGIAEAEIIYGEVQAAPCTVDIRGQPHGHVLRALLILSQEDRRKVATSLWQAGAHNSARGTDVRPILGERDGGRERR